MDTGIHYPLPSLYSDRMNNVMLIRSEDILASFVIIMVILIYLLWTLFTLGNEKKGISIKLFKSIYHIYTKQRYDFYLLLSFIMWLLTVLVPYLFYYHVEVEFIMFLNMISTCILVICVYQCCRYRIISGFTRIPGYKEGE